jgi:hypothetical protein
MLGRRISASWKSTAAVLACTTSPAIGDSHQRRRRSASWPAALPVVLPAILGTALSLAACGTPPGSFDVDDPSPSKLSNLMAVVQFKKPGPQPKPTDQVVCPDIVILDGTADYRVYGTGEQTNTNLRYQFSINDVARDCKINGNQIDLKVGVAGKLLLGPVGGPGIFPAPIRVAVVRESDQEPIVSKLYQVTVEVSPGKLETPFTLVTDQLDVPYTHANSQHDYTIKVGFDAVGNDKRAKAAIDAAANAPDRKPVPASASGSKPHHRRQQQQDPASTSN